MVKKKESLLSTDNNNNNTFDSDVIQKKSFVRVKKTKQVSSTKKILDLDANLAHEEEQSQSFNFDDNGNDSSYKEASPEIQANSPDVLPALHEEDEEADILDPEFEDEEFEDEDFEDISLEKQEFALVIPNALQRYLAELRKYPLLTREEEREVAIQAFDANDLISRNKLVTSNLRLVVKIAMEYRKAYSQILDLIQEGNAGLVQAVNRFNPYRGVKLSTYGAWWIRAYILKFLMDNKSLVRMGTTDAQRKLFFRLRGEAEKMYALTQKFDANLLAEKIGVQAQDVIEMQQRLSKNDVSLDTPVVQDSDMRQIDLLTDNSEDDIASSYEKKQMLAMLKKQVNLIEKELNERDLFIFKNRIMSDDPITLQEVGDKYKITRERARQLEARVIKKIKEKVLNAGILR